MKRKIFTMIFTSLIGVVLSAQDVPDPFMRFTFDVDGTDAMGNSYSTLMPNALIVDDPARGNVVEVNTDNGYVQLDPAVFSDVTDHTIACWYYSYDTVTQFQAAFQLIADDNNYIMLCAPRWKKYWQVHMMNGAGTYKYIADTIGPLTQEVWHHIAYTCDDGFFTLFLNGELLDTLTSVVTPVGVNADTACIGMNWQKERDVGSHALIDDFEFYKSALSAENIQTLYNSTLTGIREDLYNESKGKAFFYPNPASDELYVNSRGGEIVITNIVGAVVKRQIIQPGLAGMNLSNITPGIYLIRIDDGSPGNSSKKLIIR